MNILDKNANKKIKGKVKKRVTKKGHSCCTDAGHSDHIESEVSRGVVKLR